MNYPPNSTLGREPPRLNRHPMLNSRPSGIIGSTGQVEFDGASRISLIDKEKTTYG